MAPFDEGRNHPEIAALRGYVRRFADRWGFLNAAAFDGDLFVHRVAWLRGRIGLGIDRIGVMGWMGGWMKVDYMMSWRAE